MHIKASDNLSGAFFMAFFLVLLALMNKSSCLNCENQIEESMKFCPNCGQKNKISILGIRELISDFFSNILYLDSKLFNTLKTVFIPARGTKNYVAGKRKSYINPFRVFFISALVFFALIVSVLSAIDFTRNMSENMPRQYEKIQNYDKRQLLLDSIDMTKKENRDFIHRLNVAYNLQDADTLSIDRDTLLARNFSVNNIKEKYEIQNRDIYELTLDELYEKYKVTAIYDRLQLKLSVVMSKDIKKVVLYAANNLIWGVLTVSLFAALVLKLLYIRHSVSYVELLLLLFEFHAILFFLGSIVILLINGGMSVDHSIEKRIPIFVGIAVLYFFFELKFYFKQGIFKTIIKMIAFFFCYLILLVSILVSFAILSSVFV